MIFQADTKFERIRFDENPLPKGEYENCTFVNCDFAKVNFFEWVFVDCVFVDCDLSLAQLNHAAFREVQFKDCKMLGLAFEKCNDFGLSFSFDTCNLNHSSFYKLKIKKTVFKNCQMEAVDFTETDLMGSILENCLLHQAVFDRTNLEGCDFRASYQYIIDPQINKVKKAKFSLDGVGGLLKVFGVLIE